jgi:hypothetical protein
VADHRAARDGKRRLPVLQAAPDDDDGPPRPRWQWVVFGALAIVTTWVPTAAIAGVFVARLAARAGERASPGILGVQLAVGGAYALALAAGAATGGYVVGRWGTSRVGIREAALAGLAASLAATGASWVSLGLVPGAAVVPLVTVPAAVLGGMLGLRRRARAG